MLHAAARPGTQTRNFNYTSGSATLRTNVYDSTKSSVAAPRAWAGVKLMLELKPRLDALSNSCDHPIRNRVY